MEQSVIFLSEKGKSFFYPIRSVFVFISRWGRCVGWIVLVLVGQVLLAQGNESKKYLLTTKSILGEMGYISLVDPYFTNLSYAGAQFGVRQDQSRLFRTDSRKWSMQSVLSLTGGLLTNPAQSGDMFYGAIQSGWGAHYQWTLGEHTKLKTGGLWDFHFGVKEVPRYINNPFSMDLATNLNLAASMFHNFQFLRQNLRLTAKWETPVLGYMFVPQFGASYYEMFQLGDMTDTFHFSSLHNRLGLTQSYKLTIPLRWTDLEVGLRWQNLKYKANEMQYKYNQFSVQVGASFDVISFGGRRNKAPSNFLNVTN